MTRQLTLLGSRGQGEENSEAGGEAVRGRVSREPLKGHKVTQGDAPLSLEGAGTGSRALNSVQGWTQLPSTGPDQLRISGHTEPISLSLLSEASNLLTCI